MRETKKTNTSVTAPGATLDGNLILFYLYFYSLYLNLNSVGHAETQVQETKDK